MKCIFPKHLPKKPFQATHTSACFSPLWHTNLNVEKLKKDTFWRWVIQLLLINTSTNLWERTSIKRSFLINKFKIPKLLISFWKLGNLSRPREKEVSCRFYNNQLLFSWKIHIFLIKKIQIKLQVFQHTNSSDRT